MNDVIRLLIIFVVSIPIGCILSGVVRSGKFPVSQIPILLICTLTLVGCFWTMGSRHTHDNEEVQHGEVYSCPAPTNGYPVHYHFRCSICGFDSGASNVLYRIEELKRVEE